MQFYDVSQTSLAKSGSSVVEEYIPLWMADGTAGSYNGQATSGGVWLADGSGTSSTATSSAIKLFTLSSNYSATQNFAFEATLYANTTSATAKAALWDFSLGTPAIVSSSQITTAATTATVVRSPQFNLTPGHIYGVTIWSGSGVSVLVTDASLIVFGQ